MLTNEYELYSELMKGIESLENEDCYSVNGVLNEINNIIEKEVVKY